MSERKSAPTLLVIVDSKGVRSIRGAKGLYEQIRVPLDAIDQALRRQSVS